MKEIRDSSLVVDSLRSLGKGLCALTFAMPEIGTSEVTFFWWLNLVRFYSASKILYPKRRIESYSIFGTIVSPKQNTTHLR